MENGSFLENTGIPPVYTVLLFFSRDLLECSLLVNLKFKRNSQEVRAVAHPTKSDTLALGREWGGVNVYGSVRSTVRANVGLLPPSDITHPLCGLGASFPVSVSPCPHVKIWD